VEVLSQIPVEIVNLPDGGNGQSPILGYTSDVVQIDSNAGGFGWFIDPTPADNSEFGHAGASGSLMATGSSPAAGKMDLLTVVMHELGHVLGLGDVNTADNPGDIMDETLSPGVRRLPMPADSSAIETIPEAPRTGYDRTQTGLPAARPVESENSFAAFQTNSSLATASRTPGADLTRIARALQSGQSIAWEDRLDAAIAELIQERAALQDVPTGTILGIAPDPLDDLLGNTPWIDALKQRKTARSPWTAG
jgi:hypothetical protein